ncbi:MAG: hypothetical protein AAFZ80_11210 [Cyanobacteria bacterium P01_A01_bin.105]
MYVETCSDPRPGSPPLPADFSLLLPDGDTIRHILLGTPSAIHQTRHLLHNLRYVEVSQWSPLVQLTHQQVILTAAQGEQMSLLTRHLPR